MNNTSIKVIKRKDVQVMANVKTQSACKSKRVAPFSAEKIESRSRRALADTISNWISERRENNHAEEIAAVRKIFGSELLLNEI